MPEPIDDFDANAILTPMPGVCIHVDVKPGDVVSSGQVVAVIEAMKMQNNMFAPSVIRFWRIFATFSYPDCSAVCGCVIVFAVLRIWFVVASLCLRFFGCGARLGVARGQEHPLYQNSPRGLRAIRFTSRHRDTDTVTPTP
jgi:hypothetical protein